MKTKNLAAILVCGVVWLSMIGCQEKKFGGETNGVNPNNWSVYSDKNRGFEFKYPITWKITAENKWIMHYRDRFLSLNSMGRENFWLTEKQIHSVRFSDEIVADQLPEGCVYMDIGWWEVPAMLRFGPGISEINSDNITDLLAEAKQQSSDPRLIKREIEFWKWGRRWSIVVYIHKPVSESNVAEMEKVLRSFRFEDNPVGDEIWAIWKSRQYLPTEAEPDKFVREGGNDLRYVETEKKGNNVYVTFTNTYTEQMNLKKIWKYRVTDSGKVILISK